MLTYRGVYYFDSYTIARDFAQERGWNTGRIIRYDLGWAVQKHVSGPYYGPEDEDV